jgi:hypothetical protein
MLIDRAYCIIPALRGRTSAIAITGYVALYGFKMKIPCLRKPRFMGQKED